MLWYLGCARWHGTGMEEWLYNTAYGFRRGGSGIFSFDGNNYNWKNDNNCGRGVAVVGTGL